ncbi:hypothetical protein E4T44_01298 [Aureobasidium sp. EXF-8845]|nr:hypothetical protein E4T44_01298 [Aureobasidium sp. EXF-8845]
MTLTCYTWSTCQHTEHKNEAGEHVGITEILNEVNNPIRQQTAAYPCPACADPNGNHDGIGIRPILQASTTHSARLPMGVQMNRLFNPQVLAFQPTVAQSSDLPSDQPSIAHNNHPYSDQNDMSHHNGVHNNQSIMDQNNGLYPNLPTHSQYNNSYSNPYPFGQYTAELHNARNRFNPPGNESITHAAPYGGFNAAATEPDHFSNTADHVHGHGYAHVHAEERQGTIYYDCTEDDVEGLIVSHNSLNNYDRNHNFSSMEGMMPYNTFSPMEAVMPYGHYASTDTMVPYDSSLASMNAAKAAILKKDEHKPGEPCPDNHPNCHWHYSRWCHESPVTCRLALQAITAAFHAHGAWKDAPIGWNQVHELCVRAVAPIMCSFHAQLQRRIYGSSFDQ